jgi:hypothetical protein
LLKIRSSSNRAVLVFSLATTVIRLRRHSHCFFIFHQISLTYSSKHFLALTDPNVMFSCFSEALGSRYTCFAILRLISQETESHTKFDLACTILARVNEVGDSCLGSRREIVKRVVEFHDFTRCWNQAVLQAKGLVAEIRTLVNVKDTFTRINQERERERFKAKEARQAEIQATQRRNAAVQRVKDELFSLFAEPDPNRRGKLLEGVLNGLFQAFGILVREAFTLKLDGNGVVEQIDGAIELDSHLYIVEMKWHASPLGPADTAQHQRFLSRRSKRALNLGKRVHICSDSAVSRVVTQEGFCLVHPGRNCVDAESRREFNGFSS